MIIRPGPLTAPTSVPDVGLCGGVFPFASRTITPAKELESGSTHLDETDEDVTPATFSELTGASPIDDAPAAAGDHPTDATTKANDATTAQARTQRRGVFLPARAAVIADRSAVDDRGGGRGGGFGLPGAAGRQVAA